MKNYKTSFKRIVAIFLVTMLAVSVCSVNAFAAEITTKHLLLTKTEHSSCNDIGIIEFKNGIYTFKNSNDILGTGPMLSSSVTDFEWEFDFATPNSAWCIDRFLFHSNSAGIIESNSYILEIVGIGNGNGINLYRNTGSVNLIASYKLSYDLAHIDYGGYYHIKVKVANNFCQIWFYLVNSPETQPVISLDLGNSAITSGDFKIHGYQTQMRLKNMTVKDSNTLYIFDGKDPESLIELNNSKKLTLTKTTHFSSTDTGSIEFSGHTYSFKNSSNILGTGPIINDFVTDFEWEFDYWSDNPAWTSECFMFHCSTDGIYEGDTYCVKIRGQNYGSGPALYKDADYNNPLGEYSIPGGLKTKTWEGAIYHTKIAVKDNFCKIWFYDKRTPETEPRITANLGNASLTSGDFKIQGYGAKMNLEHIIIKTDTMYYYFDDADKPDYIGDLNYDGVVDAIDLSIECQALLSSQTDLCYDLNKDGKVDLLDFIRMKKIIIKYNEFYGGLIPEGDEIALTYASPIKVTGRAVSLAEGIALDHSASSMEFVTDSTKIALSAEVYREVFFTVYIDGERIPKRVRFSPSDSVRVIASGLNGKHTVKLVRETENMTGNKFTAKMLIMDGKLYEKPEDSKLYIEFVGDSITCGLGALHGFIDASDKETILDSQSADCIDTSTDNPIGEEDATNSYAYLCAENLGADCSLVSYSGIGLVRGWTGISMPEFYQYTSLARSNSEKYNFTSARVPDIVVVNLGTNDECIPNKPTQQEFETGVKNFIKQIRDSYKTPNLKIVWATGMMMDANAEWAKNVIDSMHDKNLYVYSNLTQGRTGHNGHPTLDHHASAAEDLAEFITNNVLN